MIFSAFIQPGELNKPVHFSQIYPVPFNRPFDFIGPWFFAARFVCVAGGVGDQAIALLFVRGHGVSGLVYSIWLNIPKAISMKARQKADWFLCPWWYLVDMDFFF